MRGRELKPEIENLQEWEREREGERERKRERERERESEQAVYWTRPSVCVKLGDGERERKREREREREKEKELVCARAYLPASMSSWVVRALVYLSIRPCLQMQVHTK